MTTIDQLETVVRDAVRNALRDGAAITPRRLSEDEAARYLNRSTHWLTRLRRKDRERIDMGIPTQGPRFFYEGTSLFYDIHDIDEWIDSSKGQVHPATGGQS